MSFSDADPTKSGPTGWVFHSVDGWDPSILPISQACYTLSMYRRYMEWKVVTHTCPLIHHIATEIKQPREWHGGLHYSDRVDGWNLIVLMVSQDFQPLIIQPQEIWNG